MEYWQQGAYAHLDCVPGHWKKDRVALEDFANAQHRIRYDLTDSGRVEAVCLKCDWWLSDWPKGVAELYSKSLKHVKGDRDSF